MPCLPCMVTPGGTTVDQEAGGARGKHGRELLLSFPEGGNGARQGKQV